MVARLKYAFGAVYHSPVLRALGILVVIFLALYLTIDLVSLIVLFNSIFVGAMVAITIAYARLVWNALWGVGEYDRVRQFTLGVVIGWAAIGLTVLNSITVRSGDLTLVVPGSLPTALSRFLAIISAIMQVTAPNFGKPLFYDRDRRLLWSGLIIGTIVAVTLILIQDNSIFPFRL